MEVELHSHPDLIQVVDGFGERVNRVEIKVERIDVKTERNESDISDIFKLIAATQTNIDKMNKSINSLAIKLGTTVGGIAILAILLQEFVKKLVP